MIAVSANSKLYHTHPQLPLFSFLPSHQGSAICDCLERREDRSITVVYIYEFRSNSRLGRGRFSQIRIHDIIQNRFPPLPGLQPGELQPARRPLRPPRDPPRQQGGGDTGRDEQHGDGEGDGVPGGVSTAEDLGADGAADLAVAVDEADGEGGARGAAGGLDAPGPHERVPGAGEGVGEHGDGVNGSRAGVGVQHGVARQDDGQEGERVQRARQAGAVGPDAEDPDADDGED